MKVDQPEPTSPLPELARLLQPGALGYYTHFETTEVFAMQPGDPSPLNVFTIIVAEELIDGGDGTPAYLNPQRIRLSKFKGWFFGVRRYLRPLSELMPALNILEAENAWRTCGDRLETARLTPMPSQFAPPDTAQPSPMNRLLKNNFWGGSHLFEWADRDKAALKPFFDHPPSLQELTEQIQKYAPIGLAAVSDRLGNVIVQLPVTVLIAKFHKPRDGSGFLVEHAWHPQATPRPLRATCQLEFDDVVTGYASAPIKEPGGTVLPMRAGRGVHRGFIWDDQGGVLLAATGEASFIETIGLNIQVADPEPRTFTVTNADGSPDPRRVGLAGHSTQSLVGNPNPDDNGGWTSKRMYSEQANRLAAERRFVQYQPEAGRAEASHQKALGDLRLLISQYGKLGAWLWDPYLSAHDILETLFYCPHQGADLRGLTTTKGGTPTDLRAELDGGQSNWRGLRLEYRVARGVAGGDFHDRFLIFPRKDEGALAWSLGTSVNGVGKAHHILQRADNGQMIMDAFVRLWGLLDGPEHLIWKKP